MGCGDLANAVILRAIHDLFCSATDYQASTPSRSEKMDAIRFLTDATGPHAASREHWCLAADKDPDALRDIVTAFLEGDDKLTAFAPPVRGNLGQDQRDEAVAESRAMFAETTQPDTAWREAAELRARQAKNRKPDDEARLRRVREVRKAAREARNGRSATSLVCNALEDGPKTAREIGFQIDGCLNPTTIYETLGRLAKRGRVTKDGATYKRA